MNEVNIPDVLAEVTAIFASYEKALVDNDIETLNRLFLESPHTLRYGPRENLHGHAEIAKFRRERGPVDQRHAVRYTSVVTFGRDFAVTHKEFVPLKGTRVGRQSQTWIRTPEGWRIASAHVSFEEDPR